MRSALGVENSHVRRDNFHNSNDVDFTKDIAKSFADRCQSRLTFKMSNVTLSKHLARLKWRLFFFAKIISRRTINLTFPSASRVDCVPIFRWDGVSTTLLSRDIDDQSFDAVTQLDDFTQRRPEPNANDVPEGHSYSVWYAGGGGGREGRGEGRDI